MFFLARQHGFTHVCYTSIMRNFSKKPIKFNVTVNVIFSFNFTLFGKAVRAISPVLIEYKHFNVSENLSTGFATFRFVSCISFADLNIFFEKKTYFYVSILVSNHEFPSKSVYKLCIFSKLVFSLGCV